MQENVILEYLQRIEKQLEIINSKLDNFMGFEELSEEDKEKLSIEAKKWIRENQSCNRLKRFC